MPVNSYTCRLVVLDKQNSRSRNLLVLVFLSLFILSTQFINAQVFQIDKPALSIDSLKKVLPLLHDSTRIDCLNELARSYMETMQKKNTDTALTTANLAYKEASAINYIKGLGDACLQIAVISYWQSWVFFESEKNYRKTISWYQKIQNDNGLEFGFKGLGASFIQQGSADEAMQAFEQSEFHFRKSSNLPMLADLKDWFSYAYELKGNSIFWYLFYPRPMKPQNRCNVKHGILFF